MERSDVMTRAAEIPDAVVRYADHPEAVVDLHLPPHDAVPTRSRRPLVVLLHGGFWRASYDRVHSRPLANALAAEGYVVATPEYRRVGAEGELAGGWPTTVEDVSAAMTTLPELLAGLGIATGRTTVMGHSAGGHLALWLANEPHRVDRVVGLAPVADLRAAAQDHLGDDATQAFLGGEPDEVPERYDAADPAVRLATRPACEVVILHGAEDDVVPLANSRGLAARHPFVTLHELPGVDHFDVIDPLSGAWPPVLDAVASGSD